MANDLNQCQFIGRLGADPETRYTPSGDCVTSFSIAVGSQWKNKDGEKQESTEWVNIVAWRKLGEICAEYLKKGSQVFISGKIKTEKYQDKEGVTKYSTKIVADQMQMLGGKSGGGEHHEAAEPARKDAKPSAAPAGKGSFDNFDDDIPFFEPCRNYGLWRSM
jgi:single-strand DNA-binding protein